MAVDRLWFGLMVLIAAMLGQTHAEGPFVEFLKQTQPSGDAIKPVAYTPAGDWVFLCGNSGYCTSNLDLPNCKWLVAV